MTKITGQEKVSIELITPELAEEYLTLNHKHNRNISNSSASRYTASLERAMKGGEYHLTHQGIAFSIPDEASSAPVLVDGQNRLTAIVRTGIPQTMMVTRGLHPDAIGYVDVGRKRDSGQQLAIVHGDSLDSLGLKKNTKALASITNFLFDGIILQTDERLGYVNQYRTSFQFVMKHFGGSKVDGISAPVLSAIICAHHNLPTSMHDRLDLFCKIFAGTNTELVDPLKDKAPTTLKEFILRNKSAKLKGGRPKAFFLVTQEAIMEFMKGKTRRSFSEGTIEKRFLKFIYPVPPIATLDSDYNLEPDDSKVEQPYPSM